MPYEIGSIEHIRYAVQQARINQVNDEELKEVLRYVMVLVGIRAKNLPDAEEKEVLLNYIRQYFGKYSLTELKLAFELAVAGDLPLKEDEVKCYENFTCVYIGTIMKAYRKYVNNLLELQPTQNNVKQLPINYDAIALINIYYTEFIDGIINWKIVMTKAYEVARDKCGLQIEEKKLLQIIEEAKEKILQQYEVELKRMSPSKDFGKYLELKETRVRLEIMPVGQACLNDDVNHYAKILCLKHWFEQQKAKGFKKIIAV